jgi:asparagine synthase (glutamine-hydrolysing)
MISGCVDWAQADAAKPLCRLETTPEGKRRVFGAGLDVLVDDGRALIAIEGACAAIVQGAPAVEGVREGTTTAERILALFRDGPTSALTFVKGRYALFFVDLASRNAVLATDRFAVWPLCYSVRDQRLAFSDRADHVPVQTREVDPQAIYDYLYFHVIPAPQTIFRRVRRLDLAQRLDFGPSAVRLSSHWKPTFDEHREADFALLTSEFRSLLRHSVEDAIHNAGSVGCFLSGGTDSSTIAGLLTETTGRPARTFSIGFNAEGYDEMAYARIAAQHFETDHTEYYVTPRDLIEGIPKVATHHDQPFGNSSSVPTYYCAKVAREAGVSKLLAGDGGDELFGGNARYAKQRVFSAYAALPDGIRAALLEPALLRTPGVRRIPLARKAASYVEQARIPMPDRMDTYNLLTRLGIDKVLDPDFLRQVDSEAAREQQRRVYAETAGAALVNRMLAYDWKYTLADNDLPKVREAARLANVTVGFPLLDDRLLDFSLRLPPAMKVRGLKLRYFFKRALRGFLPEQIIAKKKHGFGLPFGLWLVRDRDLADFARSSLAALSSHDVLRANFIDLLFRERLQQHPGYYGELAWVLLVWSIWTRNAAVAVRQPLLTPL